MKDEQIDKKVDKNADKKIRFIEYFKQLPSQKLAGASIGISDDTVMRWKEADEDFAYQIEVAKADWALRTIKGVRSKEWLLERILRQPFRPPQQKTDITSGGKPIPILGTTNAIPENNSNNQDPEPKEEN